MKKMSVKQRKLDIKRSLEHRCKKLKNNRNQDSNNEETDQFSWKKVNSWIDRETDNGLKVSFRSNKKTRHLIIHLPKVMNFSNESNVTLQCLTAIRKLVEVRECYKNSRIPNKAYHLSSVNFDDLEFISTSAALVLTAEVSKWNFSIKKKLQPKVEKWNHGIYIQLEQLGFFDLFENKPSKLKSENSRHSDVNFVRYIKGQCNDSDDAKIKKKKLKNEIASLVGEKIEKWTILHSGLTEAVTNVTHHAYPNKNLRGEKAWYLTGSYNKKENKMKVAFYDQGVGIPASLPTSAIWEKVLSFIAKYGETAQKASDAKLLEAAVTIGRTRTTQTDRGKGLQDLLEFIRERKEGYLSILSYHGLYKCWIEQGKERSKKDSLPRPLKGTLIVWSVTLG